MNLRTPLTLTDEIVRFAGQLAGRDAKPTYVPVQVAPGAEDRECYVNAERVAASRGGQVLCGWQIWEWPHILLEADFHAVVALPDGSLVDVTPSQVSSDRTLFLPTPSRTWKGEMVVSRQLEIAASSTVTKFTRACSEYWEFQRSHFDENGEDGAGVYLNGPQDSREAERLREAHARAFLALERFAARTVLPVSGTPDDRCPCGSGERIRDCHGPRSCRTEGVPLRRTR